MEYQGNKDILILDKTAFLCSQRCPAGVVLTSYDWAKMQRSRGNCIICGNHSQIEKDVFDILLNGNQPIVLVLARGMKSRWKPEILSAIIDNRLLIVSPFDRKTKRVTRITAEQRNKWIIDTSDKIVIGYCQPSGQLDRLLLGKEVELL